MFATETARNRDVASPHSAGTPSVCPKPSWGRVGSGSPVSLPVAPGVAHVGGARRRPLPLGAEQLSPWRLGAAGGPRCRRSAPLRPAVPSRGGAKRSRRGPAEGDGPGGHGPRQAAGRRGALGVGVSAGEAGGALPPATATAPQGEILRGAAARPGPARMPPWGAASPASPRCPAAARAACTAPATTT